ncbi:MAG: twin-arginine translocation signal domain-containing protein [Alphaproteobacteria bacterium]|nr:twin-arginine translocation signal domain-containing protein [Alphaproteobacteria bacterium]
MTSRRGFLRVVGTSAVILAAGGVGLTQCDPMPEEAVAAWKGPAPSVKDPRVRALSFALLAPNPHNRQPWIADLREPGAITFLCDRSRMLPETDPYSRQIMIGCGAFLELLRMAAAEQGYRAEIAAFPNGDWPDNTVGDQPVCRVAFVADQSVARDPLFAQVLKRRTKRGAYEATPVSAAEAGGVEGVLNGLPVRFGWTGEPGAMNRLRDIARRAWVIEVKKDSTYLESVKLFRITGPEIAKKRDGLSFHGPFFWWMNALGLVSKETAMAPFARQQAVDLIEADLKTPAFAWIVTPVNDRRAQLAAGAAYARATLRATEMGLSTHPLSQALQEFPEMLPLLAEHKRALGLPAGDTVQMFFRLGRATPGEPAPRRPLTEIIRS